MVAHLVRLRLLVLANTLKRSPWQLVAVIFGALYGLAVLTGVVVGLFALSAAPAQVGFTVIVIAGSVAILGWILVPLFTSGIDQTLDPAKLARFPIPRRDLLVGLTLSGIVGVPGAVTLIAALATAGTWWRYPLSAIAALVCAVVGAVTCVVASRMIAALTASLGTSRRFREITGVLFLVPVILLGPIFAFASENLTDGSIDFERLARTMSFTPIGAIWAVPGELALGNIGPAAVQLLIGVATLGVFFLIWRRALAVAIESPPRTASSSKRAGKLGLLGAFPATPTGAVAARSLIYWMRDPRYTQQLLIVPLLPIMLGFLSSTLEAPGLVNAAGPTVAFLLAMAIYADISYDNTAFATHMAAGLSGRADRAGRVIALGSFALPLVVIATIAAAWYSDSWGIIPGLLGISFGVLLTGMGLSSITSARAVFPVPAPGDSPFKGKPGSNVTAVLVTFVAWGVLGILVLPELALAVIGFVTGQAMWGWLALAVGVGLGSLLLVLGIRLGGRLLDRRAPELLAQLTRLK